MFYGPRGQKDTFQAPLRIEIENERSLMMSTLLINKLRKLGKTEFRKSGKVIEQNKKRAGSTKKNMDRKNKRQDRLCLNECSLALLSTIYHFIPSLFKAL